MLLEANAIVAATQKNGEEVGVRLPKKDTKEYFKAFNNFFEFSLDTVQLKSVFERVKRKKFGFCDNGKKLFRKTWYENNKKVVAEGYETLRHIMKYDGTKNQR